MTTNKGFRIELSSDYAEWWRYNVALMCGCFDAADNRTDFIATERHIADVGANLTEPPAENAAQGLTLLETPPCDHIVLYAYIVPHTLPRSNDIADTRPFGIDLHITYDEHPILAEKRLINQWSGASIEFRVASVSAK